MIETVSIVYAIRIFHQTSPQRRLGKENNMSDLPAYTVTYCKRRSIGIKVTQNGSIEIRAPYGTPDSLIRKVLVDKKDWINRTVTRVLDNKETNAAPSDRYFDGALFPLHGGAAELMLKEDPEAQGISVALHPDYRQNILLIRGRDLNADRVREALSMWGRKYAATYLDARAHSFAEKLQVDYHRISIRDMKSRWGSCSKDGNISLHWKLILLPERLSDYVVVHELCHRLQMNHQKEFWATVGSLLPDYKQRRAELKEHEQQILNW